MGKVKNIRIWESKFPPRNTNINWKRGDDLLKFNNGNWEVVGSYREPKPTYAEYIKFKWKLNERFKDDPLYIIVTDNNGNDDIFEFTESPAVLKFENAKNIRTSSKLVNLASPVTEFIILSSSIKNPIGFNGLFKNATYLTNFANKGNTIKVNDINYLLHGTSIENVNISNIDIDTDSGSCAHAFTYMPNLSTIKTGDVFNVPYILNHNVEVFNIYNTKQYNKELDIIGSPKLSGEIILRNTSGGLTADSYKRVVDNLMDSEFLKHILVNRSEESKISNNVIDTATSKGYTIVFQY